MKKLATLVFAMLLTGSLAFAQGTTPTTTDKPAGDTKTETKKGHKGGKKGHKGGKKNKKAEKASDTGTAPK